MFLPLLVLSSCLMLTEEDLSARKDVDGDGVPWPEDCDDRDPTVQGPVLWYLDADGDGYGDPAAPDQVSCTPSAPQEVARGGDCNDSDPYINPAMPETCAPGDEDCDGSEGDADPGGVTGTSTWHPDRDGDGYGDEDEAVDACDPPGVDWVLNGEDCNDAAAALHPGTVWFEDADGDGYGSPDLPVASCEPVSGYVLVGGDCDDHEPRAHPGLDEVCADGIDNDCSGDSTGCGLGEGLRSADEVGHRIEGPEQGAWLGPHALGDLDGDGQVELIIGAMSYAPEAEAQGAVWVFSGPVDAPALDEATAILLGGENDEVGGQLSSGADLDGDGYDELVLGAYVQDETEGRAYLLYGPLPASTEALSLAEVASTTLYADGGGSGDLFGFETRLLGDTDGDGLPELVVGAYMDDQLAANGGTVYLWYGSSERLPARVDASEADATWSGSILDENAASHNVIPGPLDVDGDGLAELLVTSLGGADGGGRVYLVHGAAARASGAHDLADADALITGPEDGSAFGDVAYALGDVDQDGYEEWCTVSRSAEARSVGWVVRGGAERLAGALQMSDVASATYLSDDSAWARAWSAGDFDGDELPDLAIGSGGLTSLATAAGGVVVFYAASVEGSWEAEHADVTLSGTLAGEGLGHFDLHAADLDGDGYDDLVADALGGDLNRGAVLLLYGGVP